jgi:thiol:disulfide interchange protein DsbC
MRILKQAVWVALSVLVGNQAVAEQASIGSEVEQQLLDRLQQAVPNIPVVAVEPSQLEGFYEITLANGERVFSLPGLDYFIAGNLFQPTDEGLVNLTELKRDKSRAALIAAISPADKITFSPAEKKASVTVFTDVDCGYCQKLHREMDAYLEAGIEINYLAYPRAGLGSSSYNKIVSAWCAKDRQDAMTRLKAGKSVESASCDNPVADQLQLARELGLRGTPAIVTESGQIISGYRSAPVLAQMLGL